MKKILMVCLSLVLLINLVSASLVVRTEDKGSVVISELDNPATYELIIDNQGEDDIIEIYSYVGLSFSPRGAFSLPSGENKIEIKAYPNKELRERNGLYNLEYEIKSQNEGIIKKNLALRVVPLKDTLQIRAENLEIKDDEVKIYVINTQNTELTDVKIKFESLFFNSEEIVSLDNYETKEVNIKLNSDDTQHILAGSYPISASIDLEGAKTQINGVMNYVEHESIETLEETKGFIVRTTSVTKKNEGNVAVYAQIDVDKGVIGRLFTTHAIEPIDDQREGLNVRYVWEKELQPGEQYTVETTTNYTIPFVLFILVVIIGIIAGRYTSTEVVLSKRVSFVKTKGEEFALKVRLHVKAKANVSNISVVDSIPATTKLYDKFGIRPDKIDVPNRKLTWFIKELRTGEERVFSYVVYSKVKIVGRFELPNAVLTFTKDNKNQNVLSNRAYFVSETLDRSE